MKVRYFWAILLALSFYSCDDTTESLGLDMLPSEDKIEVTSKSYGVTTRSILADRVYARTDTAYIGRFKEDLFGTYDANFLVQLNCLDSLRFPAVYDEATKEGLMVDDTTVSTELVLTYNKFFGDSIAPMHLNIFELNKVVEDDPSIHYTDLDEAYYFDRDTGFIGEAAFTAADLGVSDSIKQTPYYEPQIRVSLPKEIGDEILRKNREHPEYFDNNQAFIENVFKGVYAECDEGSGTILYVDQVALNIKFEYFVLDSIGNKMEMVNGNDSTAMGVMSFVGTKEVYQLNKLTTSPEKLAERVAEKEHTYLKSPAGVFTEVTLPIKDILADEEVKNDTIHSVKLKLDSYLNKQDTEFPMDKPGTLLLVRKSKMISFFEANEINDNITSYVTNMNSKGQYIFPNISRLINTLVAEKKEAQEEAGQDWNEEQWIKDNEWDKVVLIPVTLDTMMESDYWGRPQLVVINIRHNLKPEYARLKGGDVEQGGTPIDLEVIYTSFNE